MDARGIPRWDALPKRSVICANVLSDDATVTDFHLLSGPRSAKSFRSRFVNDLLTKPRAQKCEEF